MREIKFRGYSKTNNMWFYGLLGKFDDKYYIECNGGTKPFVEEDSIGQYIGFKDENDKEIYEGDVLNWDVDAYGYVEMINGSWQIFPEFLTMEDYYIDKMADKVKVIGNIYEDWLKTRGKNEVL